MNVMATPRMTVDEFLAWAEGRPGKYELFGGVVQQMSPERADHVRVKASVWLALRQAVRGANLACEALADGMTVRIDAHKAFVPDVVLHCEERLAGESIEISKPVVVVEVLSPSTASADASSKLSGYFLVPSIQHYLIVAPEDRTVIHHRRTSGGAIETRVASDGVLALDPPGLTVSVADFFEDLR